MILLLRQNVTLFYIIVFIIFANFRDWNTFSTTCLLQLYFITTL